MIAKVFYQPAYATLCPVRRGKWGKKIAVQMIRVYVSDEVVCVTDPVCFSSDLM